MPQSVNLLEQQFFVGGSPPDTQRSLPAPLPRRRRRDWPDLGTDLASRLCGADRGVQDRGCRALVQQLVYPGSARASMDSCLRVGRCRRLSAASCRMLVIQNNTTTIVLIGIALLLVAGALVGDRKRAAALVAAGLLMAFTALAIGVHAHGWVTAYDANTASWIGNASHRSHGLDEASLKTARLGSSAVLAAAGLIGGALLSWRARSVRPGVIVIATVGAATLAETAIKAIVYRPLTQAEVPASPLLLPITIRFRPGTWRAPARCSESSPCASGSDGAVLCGPCSQRWWLLEC